MPKTLCQIKKAHYIWAQIKFTLSNSLKTLRENLGLSQQELAYYLEISKSHISMAESDYRNLPFETGQKVFELETWLRKNEAVEEDMVAQASTDWANNEVLEELRAIVHQQKNILWTKEPVLQKMEKKYAQAIKLLHIVNLKKATNTATEGQRLMLELLEGTSKSKLHKNSKYAQAALRQIIAQSHRVLADAEQLIGEIEKTG